MKILFLLRSLSLGGAQRQLVTLARGLHARGHRVTVAVFYPGGALESELTSAGIPLRLLDKRGRWDLVRFQASLRALVRSEAPDILHGYLLDPNLLSLLVKPWFPSLKIVWGIRWSALDIGELEWLSRMSFWLAPRAARWADAIIVNSEAGLACHRALGFPSDRLVYIPNGIDTARFAPDQEAGLRQRRVMGIAEDVPLIGLVGRLDPIKDHRTFIQAAALLARERPEARFVCVGTGPAAYRDELMDLAERVEVGSGTRVTWIEAVAEPSACYNALDLLVSSSVSEGFSNVIGEALACGTRCVVTDVGDSARIVGDPARVVPPGRPELLCQAMARALSEPALAPESLRRRITEEYGVAQLVLRTEGLLESVMRMQRPLNRAADLASVPRVSP